LRHSLVIFLGIFTWAFYGYLFWENEQVRYEKIDMSYAHVNTLIVESPLIEEKENKLEKKVSSMVSGHPIEAMVPYIVQQDEMVAAYLVSIAKKESNWGKRVPVLEGQDCYNYWGYRGKRERMGTGGHTCFDNPEDAVETVGKRIATLVHEYERDTPEEMVYWKCGFGCDTHDPQSVQKWIDDVDLYYERLMSEDRS
jgi:hypothetical protein